MSWSQKINDSKRKQFYFRLFSFAFVYLPLFERPTPPAALRQSAPRRGRLSLHLPPFLYNKRSVRQREHIV
jgi:hypothetical protein